MKSALQRGLSPRLLPVAITRHCRLSETSTYQRIH